MKSQTWTHLFVKRGVFSSPSILPQSGLMAEVGPDAEQHREALQLLSINLERRWEAIVMQALQWQNRLKRELGEQQVGLPSHLHYTTVISHCRRPADTVPLSEHHTVWFGTNVSFRRHMVLWLNLYHFNCGAIFIEKVILVYKPNLPTATQVNEHANLCKVVVYMKSHF